MNDRHIFIGGPWHLHEAALPGEPREYRIAVSAGLKVWLQNAVPDSYGLGIEYALYRRYTVPNLAQGGSIPLMLYERTVSN